MNSKRLMILGAGHYQVPLIRKAQEMGLYTIVVSRKGLYPGFRIADKIYEIDTKDTEAILKAAKEERIDGITTAGTDVAVKAIGRVCDALGLTGLSAKAADIVTDKAKMKEAFRGRVSTSDFRVVRTLSEAKEAAREIGYPVMVKACDVSGSRGVTKAGTEEAVEAAFGSAVRASGTDHFIVEKFEEGEEIGLDAFVSGGKICFFAPHRKINRQVGNVTVPVGHSFPCGIGPELTDRIRAELEKIISATGMDNCAVNCDLMIRPDGSVSVLEAGGRCGATCIPELIEMHTGIDYYSLLIRAALGMEVKPEPDRAVPCTARLIFSMTDGYIRDIDREAIRHLRSGGAEVSLDFGIGDHVFSLHDGTDRIGEVIIADAGADEAERIAEAARQAVTIEPERELLPGQKKKKIMMLGGNFFQMTATIAAKKAGYHVISVDYLPDNPAHRYADEYYNISTLDREKVLEKARELEIDGIVSYASDVSAPTAAYVAEALGLPTNPYESVNILTHKNLFRRFLKENGFPMPKGSSFKNREDARAFLSELRLPAMIKPVDSSGSKGVIRIEDASMFDEAFDEAMSYSFSKEVILEEFIVKTGCQMDGDIFVDGGKIVFWGLCDQHHDPECSLYAPTGLSFPATMPESIERRAREQLERILSLLGMKMGGYNIEYIAGEDGEVYILEIGPRNGGNLIPDVIREACDVDMADATVRQAVGDPIISIRQKKPWQCASSLIVHSAKDGIYRGIEIDPEMQKHIVMKKMFVREGERVSRFRNAAFGIGAMILRFDDIESLIAMTEKISSYIRVVTE